MLTKKKTKMSYTRMLALGFALIILIGALLLSLPFATKSRECMPFLDALFTATSATCVTGLVVADTYQNWSLFGQLVILTPVSYTHLDVYKRQPYCTFLSICPVDRQIFMVYCRSVVTDKKIQYCIISYSEWWRYIGPAKPRQPLKGRCQPERAFRTIRGFDYH